MIFPPCPICQKRLEARELRDLPSFPFCSERCRLIDLGRWLGGEYQMPARPLDEDDLEEGGLAADDAPVP